MAANLRVAVIDRVPLSPTQMAHGADAAGARADYVPSARVSTITPANSRFLAGLGAWDGCVSPHAAPFHRMQVGATGRTPSVMRQTTYDGVRWCAVRMRPPLTALAKANPKEARVSFVLDVVKARGWLWLPPPPTSACRLLRTERVQHCHRTLTRASGGGVAGESQVWDTSGMGHVQYTAADAGAAVLGHVVENHVLQGQLHRLLTDRQGVQVFSGVGVGAWTTRRLSPG